MLHDLVEDKKQTSPPENATKGPTLKPGRVLHKGSKTQAAREGAWWAGEARGSFYTVSQKNIISEWDNLNWEFIPE